LPRWKKGRGLQKASFDGSEENRPLRDINTNNGGKYIYLGLANSRQGEVYADADHARSQGKKEGPLKAHLLEEKGGESPFGERRRPKTLGERGGRRLL